VYRVVVLDLFIALTGLKERLTWDTTNTQTRTSKRLLLLNTGYFKPELSRANGRDIAARAGADHDKVKMSWAHGSLLKEQVNTGSTGSTWGQYIINAYAMCDV
jgi:hypothetical protein